MSKPKAKLTARAEITEFAHRRGAEDTETDAEVIRKIVDEEGWTDLVTRSGWGSGLSDQSDPLDLGRMFPTPSSSGSSYLWKPRRSEAERVRRNRGSLRSTPSAAAPSGSQPGSSSDFGSLWYTAPHAPRREAPTTTVAAPQSPKRFGATAKGRSSRTSEGWL